MEPALNLEETNLYGTKVDLFLVKQKTFETQTEMDARLHSQLIYCRQLPVSPFKISMFASVVLYVS